MPPLAVDYSLSSCSRRSTVVAIASQTKCRSSNLAPARVAGPDPASSMSQAPCVTGAQYRAERHNGPKSFCVGRGGFRDVVRNGAAIEHPLSRRVFCPAPRLSASIALPGPVINCQGRLSFTRSSTRSSRVQHPSATVLPPVPPASTARSPYAVTDAIRLIAVGMPRSWQNSYHKGLQATVMTEYAAYHVCRCMCGKNSCTRILGASLRRWSTSCKSVWLNPALG